VHVASTLRSKHPITGFTFWPVTIDVHMGVTVILVVETLRASLTLVLVVGHLGRLRVKRASYFALGTGGRRWGDGNLNPEGEVERRM